MSIKNAIILVVLQAAFAADVWAAPAAPMTLQLQQPNGYRFAAIPRGDEFAHWMETEDGHSIIKSQGTWYYAISDGKGGLMASDLEVGVLLPEELRILPLHLSPTTDPEVRFRGPIRKIRRPPDDSLGKAPQVLAVPAIQNVLFILVDYSDQVFTYPDSSFESLAFAATDSVKEYFLENSYGQMTVSPAAETYGVANDGIVHVTRGITHPNLGQSNWSSEAREIVSLADSFVQFSSFDTNVDGTISPEELSLVIILAGYETSYGGQANALQPNVWGHAAGFSTLTLDGVNLSPYAMFGEAHAISEQSKHLATIGVMCHELGHLMFALPDLYDTDQSSAGIGVWGLMGAGSWNSTGSYSGETPAHLSAWSKIATAMTSPNDILTDQSAVGFADVESNESVVRVWADKYKVATNEYFLLENRQLSGYDAGLPGAGLLIWHIDNGKTGNADESHKRVDVEEADGLGELDSDTNGGNAGDPFPGSANNMLFDDGSTPNSRDYSGASTQIAVSNISPSSANMSADIQVRAGGYTGHVRYDENGFETAWGLGQTLWLGLNMLNDTTYTLLDGVEVFILDNAGATVDISFYESMAGGTPSNLIYSETGFAAVRGWNRFLFSTPQSFPAASERGIIVKVMNAGSSFSLVIDASGTPSGRSYFDQDGIGAYAALCATPFCGDLNIVGLLGSAGPPPPAASVITPQTTGPTNADAVQFSIDFNQDVVNFNDQADVVINHSGTAHSGVSITGSGASFTATVTGISGDGSFNLSVDTTSDVENTSGDPLASSVTSASVHIDNTAPSLTIGDPSLMLTKGGPVSYLLNYSGADAVSLSGTDVTLNKSGSADGSIAVTGTGTASRTVTISNISGDGSLGISIDSGTASDTAGNSAAAAGPGNTFSVDNTGPAATAIVPDTSGPTNADSLDFSVTFDEDVINFNDAADVTVNHSGTANAGVTVSGSGAVYEVSITGITGDGSFTVAIDTGSDVQDVAGNLLDSSVSSGSVTIDNTPPTVTIGAPSETSTANGPVSYQVSYSGANLVSLDASDVTLNASGDASGSVMVSGSGNSSRTVVINNITGEGSLSISIADGTATDDAENSATAQGPSQAFSVVPLPVDIFGDSFE